jgi:hypothetical protein
VRPYRDIRQKMIVRACCQLPLVQVVGHLLKSITEMDYSEHTAKIPGGKDGAGRLQRQPCPASRLEVSHYEAGDVHRSYFPAIAFMKVRAP